MRKVLSTLGLLGLCASVGACDPIHPKVGGPEANTDSKGDAKGSSTEPKKPDGAASKHYRQKSFKDIVFFVQTSANGNSNKALHSGKVRFERGCLYVGDAVVVWHPRTEGIVKDLIAEAKAGVSNEISIGGGGRSLSEDGAAIFPKAIQKVCGATSVWYSDGKIDRPFSGCKGKTCDERCDPCRADDPSCIKGDKVYRCDALLRCSASPVDCNEGKPKKKPCADLDEATCNATNGCQMASGERLDNINKCKAAEAKAGCTSRDCGDEEEVLAKDKSGAVWRFATSCYPDAWEQIEEIDAPKGWESWGSCSSAQ